jgi:DMSO/TMAO reductase YedYZ heme-binding membrane subunit
MTTLQTPAPRAQKPVRPEPPTAGERLLDLAPALVGAMVGIAALAGVGLLLGGGTAGLAALQATLLSAESAWNLSRAAAFMAYLLLWWSMLLGLSITNRLARLWPGGPTAGELHEQAGLLGLGFTAIHGLALLGDQYISFTLPQLLIPFASSYAPLWVGLGQIGLILMALVTSSFYVRRQIGAKTWRKLHYLSFAVFVLALLHGLFSGSDSGTLWALALYLISGVSVVGMTIYRIMAPRRPTTDDRQR